MVMVSQPYLDGCFQHCASPNCYTQLLRSQSCLNMPLLSLFELSLVLFTYLQLHSKYVPFTGKIALPHWLDARACLATCWKTCQPLLDLCNDEACVPMAERESGAVSGNAVGQRIPFLFRMLPRFRGWLRGRLHQWELNKADPSHGTDAVTPIV